MRPAIPSLAAPAALLLLLAGSAAHAFDVTVTSAAASSGGGWAGGTWTPTAAGSVVSAAEVAARLASGPVTINATGTDALAVRAGLAWSAHTLTLHTGGALAIQAPLAGTGTAGLALEYGSGYTVSAPVHLAATGSYRTQQGASASVVYTLLTSLGAEGSATGADLQGMQGDPAGHYALGADIDASATAGWDGGAGFVPVGDAATPFTGRLDGLGHVVSGLSIDRPTLDETGLFGYARNATLSNLGLEGGSVTGQGAVGALAGHFEADGGAARIANAYAATAVAATGGIGHLHIGGLVGLMNATPGSTAAIEDAYASGAVAGDLFVGGLVGTAAGGGATVARTYAAGPVAGDTASTGGLIGRAMGGASAADSFWDTLATGQGASAGGTGMTSAGLRQLATFAGWHIDDAGGTGTVWRIYDGFTAPLLRSFFTAPLTVAANDGAKPWDGTPGTGQGVTYAPAGPDARLQGTVSTTVAGGGAPGTHAITVGGLYSGQRGYDIARVEGRFTITGPGGAAAIPTLSPWGVLLLPALLALAALRRRA